MSDSLRCGVWSVEEVRRIAGSCVVLHKADWSTVNRRSGAKKARQSWRKWLEKIGVANYLTMMDTWMQEVVGFR